MKVLVACEYSGRVRDAFLRAGHDAMSCDLLPTEVSGPHYRGNIEDILYSSTWDLLIAHPPCTYLCNSGVKHLYKEGRKENGTNQSRWGAMRSAVNFFLMLWNAPVKRKCVENPIMHGHAKKLIGPTKYQIIQPWMFGHGETKATCLHLDNLPELQPTNIVSGRDNRVHRMSPSPDRWKERSRTYQGISDAMAAQWGGL